MLINKTSEINITIAVNGGGAIASRAWSDGPGSDKSGEVGACRHGLPVRPKVGTFPHGNYFDSRLVLR
jgi:hypothetical protein